MLSADNSCRALQESGSTLFTAPKSLRVSKHKDVVSKDSLKVVTLSPDQFEVTKTLKAGDSFACLLKISNRLANATVFQIKAFGIESNGSDDIRLVGAKEASSKNTAATWVKPLVSSVTLSSNESGTIPVVVSVPQKTIDGGYFATVEVLAKPNPKNKKSKPPSNVGIFSGASVPILMQVGNKGVTKLSLSDGHAAKLLVNRSAWIYRARIQNTGTTHATPRGRVRIRSIFGKTIATLPIEARTLLPNGSVKVSAKLKQTPWIGFYRYDVNVSSLADNKAIPAKQSGWFFTLPAWWKLTLLIALFVAIIYIPFTKRRREWRSYVHEVEKDLFDS